MRVDGVSRKEVLEEEKREGGVVRREGRWGERREWEVDHLHEVCFQDVIEIFGIIIFTVHPVGDHDISTIS